MFYIGYCRACMGNSKLIIPFLRELGSTSRHPNTSVWRYLLLNGWGCWSSLAWPARGSNGSDCLCAWTLLIAVSKTVTKRKAADCTGPGCVSRVIWPLELQIFSEKNPHLTPYCSRPAFVARTKILAHSYIAIFKYKNKLESSVWSWSPTVESSRVSSTELFFLYLLFRRMTCTTVSASAWVYALRWSLRFEESWWHHLLYPMLAARVWVTCNCMNRVGFIFFSTKGTC